MALVDSLSQETLADLTTIVHEEYCLDEDMEFDGDDEEEHECIAADLNVVQDLLEVLDQAGVSHNPLFRPNIKG